METKIIPTTSCVGMPKQCLNLKLGQTIAVALVAIGGLSLYFQLCTQSTCLLTRLRLGGALAVTGSGGLASLVGITLLIRDRHHGSTPAINSSSTSLEHLPNELLDAIFKRLPIDDLHQTIQVNKHFESIGKHVLIDRARKYSYRENDFKGASAHLNSLLHSIQILINQRYIPKNYIIYQKSGWFRTKINLEKTLDTVKNFDKGMHEELGASLCRAFIRYARYNTYFHTGGALGEFRGHPICLSSYNFELTNALLVLGVNPNFQRDTTDRTVLVWATMSGCTEAVKLFLQFGANPNIQIQDGKTALMFAADWERTKIVELLLQHGADPNIQNQNGDTPLMLATSRGDTEAIKLLLQHAANPNTQNQSGDTPLILAASRGNTEAVKLLLQYGADPRIPGGNGKMPLMLAIMSRNRFTGAAHEEVICLLIRNGAPLE